MLHMKFVVSCVGLSMLEVLFFCSGERCSTAEGNILQRGTDLCAPQQQAECRSAAGGGSQGTDDGNCGQAVRGLPV